MVHGEFTDNLTPMLSRLYAGLKDPAPLSAPLSAVVREGNAQGLGTDAAGNPLAPLKESTLKRRKGSGPPLAPQGSSSSLVTGAVVTAGVSDGQVRVELSWPGLPWMRYAVSGTEYTPPRDVAGVRPETVTQVADALKNYADELMS